MRMLPDLEIFRRALVTRSMDSTLSNRLQSLWAREQLLWSLRNRLVTAYIFIAVVPVLLLLTMAGLGAYLLYWQLGSYVLYTEMEDRIERLSEVAGTMATAYAIEASSGRQAAALAMP